MKTIYCIPDADELISSIVEELPNKRGEAYYALSLVLEMLSARRTEMFVPEDGERIVSDVGRDTCACSDDCDDRDDDDENTYRFKMTIDAYDLEDLRTQMRDAYAHTYSDSFGKGENIG